MISFGVGILASTPKPKNGMLKQVVEQNTKRVVKWLATAMERLAGCKSSDPKITIEVKSNDPQEEGEEAAKNKTHKNETAPIDTASLDDISLVSQEQTDPTQQVETAC
jgi:hypothetical protein